MKGVTIMVKIKYPPNIQWEVTSECNHNCLYCYNYWRKDEEIIACMTKQLSEEQYMIMAKRIVQQRPITVVITGGEPFVVFERVKSSIKYMIDNGIKISINTNIALLNDSIASFLKENKIGLFVSFPCSVPEICDKITSRKGSRDRIVEKLDKAFEHGISFGINMVVSRLNIDYIETSVDFLINRYKLRKISLTRVSKPVNSDYSFDKNLLDFEGLKKLQDISVKLAKKYGIIIETSCPYTACSIYSQEAFDMFAYKKCCTAGKTTYAIDVDGNVKACPRDSKTYGNILKDEFEEIWEAMISWRDGSFLPDECKNCKVLSKCFGGCRVDSYPFTGKMNNLDTISNPSNLPIKFEKTVIEVKKNDYLESDIFVVSDNTEFNEDNGFFRASAGNKYIFITVDFFEFLKAHSSFSLKTIMEEFDESIQMAQNVVGTLSSLDIIYQHE